MKMLSTIEKLIDNASTFKEATASGNPRVFLSLVGPAVRGFLLERGKSGPSAELESRIPTFFDWRYTRDRPDLARLYSAAKQSQWDADTAVDWTIEVDPHHPERELMRDEALPLMALPGYNSLPKKQQQLQRHALLSWMLSQSLHGEQGALFAATQVTDAVRSMDGKLYASTQVVDEGRHVEVFHRYLTEKLGKLYQINDNLYVIIDALMTDSRWDIKFLGMQIMIEGLALGAFGTIRASTDEPLLREILKYVITDEARHVHFGVLALKNYYQHELNERDRRDREDWAFELSLLMRNRFLAHEFYDEYYAHALSRSTWNKILLNSEFMGYFRRTMFRRIIPNLKRIGLLSPRVRPHYAALGILAWENDKAAPDLTAAELVGD